MDEGQHLKHFNNWNYTFEANSLRNSQPPTIRNTLDI